ncbi:MAG TPA: toprim domain-containing protein, partial [Candidatus Binataceae bacterium]|nr:toprim domain-containing protein [Candidatus Binataceae bacterium]
AGFKETVASLGTSLTVEQLRLLARYTTNIFACFDGDPAGHKASLRALDVFLGAGLLARGVFIPSGFDPDTLLRDRGAQAFTELIDAAELLVDYFIEDKQRTLGGPDAPVDRRAEAARQIGEKLRLVSDQFQFNLLVSKAIRLLGLGQKEEQIIREFGRQSGAANQSIRRGSIATPALAMRSTARGDAVAQAEIGLVAIALNYAELRAELAAQLQPIEFNDPMLRAMLEEICVSDEARAPLEVRILAGLSENQRDRLSALMVGPLMVDADGARRMATDFISALARSRQRREVESLRRVAAGTVGDDAAAAAQAVIALRRQGHEGS